MLKSTWGLCLLLWDQVSNRILWQRVITVNVAITIQSLLLLVRMVWYLGDLCQDLSDFQAVKSDLMSILSNPVLYDVLCWLNFKIFEDLSISCKDLQRSFIFMPRSPGVFYFLSKIFNFLAKTFKDLQTFWEDLWRLMTRSSLCKKKSLMHYLNRTTINYIKINSKVMKCTI